MKSFKSNACLIIGFMLANTLFPGCKPEAVCVEEQKESDAKIVSVSGPATLKVGEPATITIGVRNDLSVCVRETNAIFTDIDLDTLRINATLKYTERTTKNDCNCKEDTIIYTLLYFTPLNSGTYHIIAGKDSAIHSSPNDTLSYIIDVE